MCFLVELAPLNSEYHPPPTVVYVSVTYSVFQEPEAAASGPFALLSVAEDNLEQPKSPTTNDDDDDVEEYLLTPSKVRKLALYL